MLTEDEVREAAAQFAARATERDRHRVRRERAEQDRRVRMARKARVRARTSSAGGSDRVRVSA